MNTSSNLAEEHWRSWFVVAASSNEVFSVQKEIPIVCSGLKDCSTQRSISTIFWLTFQGLEKDSPSKTADSTNSNARRIGYFTLLPKLNSSKRMPTISTFTYNRYTVLTFITL